MKEFAIAQALTQQDVSIAIPRCLLNLGQVWLSNHFCNCIDIRYALLILRLFIPDIFHRVVCGKEGAAIRFGLAFLHLVCTKEEAFAQFSRIFHHGL